MKHEESSFQSADGLRLYYQTWQPDGSPVARLVIVHGLGEHSGRYGNVVDYFVPRGYGICALDLRGHGRSEGPRGHVQDFAHYVEDLRRFVGLVQGSQPDVPTFMVGHSLGGLIALSYGLCHPEGLRGMVVSSPWIEANAAELPPVQRFLSALFAKPLSALLPTLPMHNGLNPNYLSHDPAVAGAYEADPLVHHTITPRAFTEIVRAAADVVENAGDFRLPILLLVASGDKLVLPAATVEFFGRLRVEDRTLKVYDGFYHELFNEVEKATVLRDVGAWVEKRVR
ncbi:MAG: lysophospholipase [Chloroflexi bacterium]|nr:lysophospholipase [Chloroflexota bacterium]